MGSKSNLSELTVHQEVNGLFFRKSFSYPDLSYRYSAGFKDSTKRSLPTPPTSPQPREILRNQFLLRGKRLNLTELKELSTTSAGFSQKLSPKATTRFIRICREGGSLDDDEVNIPEACGEISAPARRTFLVTDSSVEESTQNIFSCDHDSRSALSMPYHAEQCSLWPSDSQYRSMLVGERPVGCSQRGNPSPSHDDFLPAKRPKTISAARSSGQGDNLTQSSSIPTPELTYCNDEGTQETTKMENLRKEVMQRQLQSRYEYSMSA